MLYDIFVRPCACLPFVIEQCVLLSTNWLFDLTWKAQTPSTNKTQTPQNQKIQKKTKKKAKKQL